MVDVASVVEVVSAEVAVEVAVLPGQGVEPWGVVGSARVRGLLTTKRSSFI